MVLALAHARIFAEYLNKCDSRYIIQLALKELGISSACDGFQYAKNAAIMLDRNRDATLSNGVFLAVGMLRNPPAGESQVDSAIRWAISAAWENRSVEIWHYYFPAGEAGVTRCPSNREFLLAIVDFVDMWKGCCEEVNYGK